MERAVLVTEAQTPLGRALVRMFFARGLRVAAAVDSGAGGGEAAWPAEYRAPLFLSIPWNRRSPVSAHGLLVAALNSFGSLEEALLLEPPVASADISRCASADIEKAFDDLKGAAFLARELFAHFSAAGSGVLSLASCSPRPADQAGPFLEQAVREGFHGLASSFLAAHTAAPLLVNGFQGCAASPEELAAFIDRTLDEKGRKVPGRWFVLQPRSGILRGRPEKGSSS